MVTHGSSLSKLVELIGSQDSESEVVAEIESLRHGEVAGSRPLVVPATQVQVSRCSKTHSYPEVQRYRTFEDPAIRRDNHQARQQPLEYHQFAEQR